MLQDLLTSHVSVERLASGPGLVDDLLVAQKGPAIIMLLDTGAISG